MMALPDEILSTLGPIVESVAADMSRRYRQYGGSQEDLASEGWLWVYQHPRRVIEWFDPDLTEPRAGQKMLAQTLRNELSDVGEDLKAQHLGYSRDDLSFYSRQMVRDLLPSMFDEEAWLHPEQGDGERRGRGAPAEGGNWVATLADVSRAYATLSKEDRDLLAAFHRDGWLNKMVASEYGVSEQTMSYRHDQAIRRLVTALGGPKSRPQHFDDCDHEHNGWAGRRAVSNAAARSYQQSTYEEGE